MKRYRALEFVRLVSYVLYRVPLELEKVANVRTVMAILSSPLNEA